MGATESSERTKVRAERDALVAHLYGLAEEEFACILTTFPLVLDAVKIAAPQFIPLRAAGEDETRSCAWL